MLKLCDKSIITPLSLLFQNCIDTRTFPDTWKKSNIVPVHKKGDKQIVDNYRPVSLLLILGKILSLGSDIQILVNINFSQYCMKFINLLIVIHQKMSGIFLDLSKAFDGLWHDGLSYKIKRIGITDNSLKLIESFLSNRFQWVGLNGQ